MAVDILLGTSTKMPLGGLNLDSIRLKESKEYRFSQSQALALIGLNKGYLARLRVASPNKAQSLTTSGFTWTTVMVRFHDGSQNRTAKTLSLSDLTILCRCEDRWGNDKAAAVLDSMSGSSPIAIKRATPQRTSAKYLYVIGDLERGVCKIGISADVQRRLKELQTAYPFQLQIWSSLEVQNPRAIEATLHKKLDDFRLFGEWFDSSVYAIVNWSSLA